MSFYDVFRGFFGFPGRGRPRDPLFGRAAWDEDEEEDEDGGPSMSQPPQDFGFGFSPGSPRGAFEELFRDMGELLGALGGVWAEPREPFEPALPRGEGSARGALRDSMLKQPENPPAGAAPGGSGELGRPWRPFLGLEDAPRAPHGPKEDQDLDSQVSSVGLGNILTPSEPKSYFQSVSVTKVTLPDGAVEERRTVQDSRGHRETTVTRWGGDQPRSTTREEDGHRKEEVLSVEDRELLHFAAVWPQQDELRGANLSDPTSVLGSFFQRWFSSW